MVYRQTGQEEITRELFGAFIRRQQVTLCRRKAEGRWTVRENPFVDDWDEGDYRTLVQCLQNTVRTGGAVYGAFEAGALKGFASVESVPLLSTRDALALSALHVSADRRGRGMGRALFALAAQWAREKGARKLYISAHSAVETQAFYAAMGCVEAREYDRALADREPCDCQLEYAL